uniref:Glutamate--cysteine ligase n=1 Tax=candidate division WOR-3 bacterium TaxID=2052148 RepID=A0A7C4THK3_UNCW3
MSEICLRLKKVNPRQILKSLELAQKEGETNLYGIEKEFAFVRGCDLYPVQRIGKQSAYKFITTYGNIPYELRTRMMPEVFDYMIEVITEPEFFYHRAVDEIMRMEANLWCALSHIQNEFPNMDEILLSSGTLYKPAMIESDNIPEVWGRDKKAYLQEMVRRYGEKLTPQGMHGNISIPEPLIEYQYHHSDKKKERGSIGYVEFKNEVYVWLACRLRAFASLIIAIEANSPFDYVKDGEKFYTVITGFHSNRWARLPRIESTSHPLMLKNYRCFQLISRMLIDKGVIIGANNYMPLRPKGERRLGEMPLSFERACWLNDVMLDKYEIEIDPLLLHLRNAENLEFIEKLEIAEKSGWLKKKGYTLDGLIKLWQKENVRRLLAVPLNRIEIRCEESGGVYEFELAKCAFIMTLSLYLFSNPEFGEEFDYSKRALKLAEYNEEMAMKSGLNCSILHPFRGKEISMRIFLKELLNKLEGFAREIGTFNDLHPLYELAQGEKNEAEKKIDYVLKYLGKNPKKTKSGYIIVPEELIKNLLIHRKKYLLGELSSRMNWRLDEELAGDKYLEIYNLTKNSF